MKASGTIMKSFVALCAVFMFMIPSVGTAVPITVQTEANAGNASAGESGANIGSSALISVVVTEATGASSANLGESVGDGTGEISLPAGWTLFSNLSVPPGGCLLTPTEFHNWGNGSYNIRVVPFLGNAFCSWLLGDYHYVVTINKNVGSRVVRGSGLGVLTIQ